MLQLVCAPNRTCLDCRNVLIGVQAIGTCSGQHRREAATDAFVSLPDLFCPICCMARLCLSTTLLQGEEADLGDVEQESIMAACRAWVRGPGEEDLGLGKLSMTRIKAAFRALRSIALEGAGSSAGAAHAGAGSPAASGGAGKAGRGREDHDAAAGPRTGAEDGAALTVSCNIRMCQALQLLLSCHFPGRL